MRRFFLSLGLLTTVLAACELGQVPPVAPDNLSAEALSATSVRLTWDGAGRATGYTVERKTDSEPYSEVATPEENEYTDTGLTPDTRYTYRVSGTNRAGRGPRAEVSVTTTPEPGAQRVVATGLNGPLGVLVAEDGSVYAIDSGTGGETEVAPGITLGDTARIIEVTPGGEQTDVATLPSLSADGFAVGGSRLALLDGALYATYGDWDTSFGPERLVDLFGTVLRIEEGEATVLADTWAFEVAENPDGLPADPEAGVDGVHSHPYDMTPSPQGTLYVTDAGGNSLLEVDPATGEIELVTAFEQLTLEVDGEAVQVQFVPTGVAVGGDGTIYVSSFYQGIVQITPDGEVSPYSLEVGGLTDLELGPDGLLYGVTLGEETEEGPVPGSGQVIRILADGTPEVALAGLSSPSAIDFAESGDAYLTVNTFGAPGSGEVIKVARLFELTAQ